MGSLATTIASIPTRRRRVALIGRRFVLAGLALAVLAVAAATPAGAADKIVAALNPAGVGGNVLVFIGKEKGFFDAAGVDVDIARIDSPLIPPALASGSADVAITSLSAGFFNTAANSDFVLLAAASYERAGYNGQVIVASKAAYDAGLKTPADLAGKRIGLPSFGSVFELHFYNLALKYQFPFGSYKLVNVANTQNQLAALQAGTIDATVMQTMNARPLESAGTGHIIAYVGQEVPTMGISLFTTRKVLATKHDALVKFVKGYLAAARLYDEVFQKAKEQNQAPPTARATDLLNIISKNTGAPVDVVVQSLAYIQPDAEFQVSDVEQQLSAYQKLGMSDANIKAANLIDKSILEAAKQN